MKALAHATVIVGEPAVEPTVIVFETPAAISKKDEVATRASEASAPILLQERTRLQVEVVCRGNIQLG